MNKLQVLEIVETIESFYNKPWTKNEKNVTAKEKIKSVVELWYKVLKDYEFDIVSENLENHIKNNKFVPVIADLANPLKEKRERYIPTAEETKAMLEKEEKEADEVANDPETIEAKKKAQHEIRRMLGIKREG